MTVDKSTKDELHWTDKDVADYESSDFDVDDHLRDHLHEFQPANWARLKERVAAAWAKGVAAGAGLAGEHDATVTGQQAAARELAMKNRASADRTYADALARKGYASVPPDGKPATVPPASFGAGAGKDKT